jgi:hypothetical protein
MMEDEEERRQRAEKKVSMLEPRKTVSSLIEFSAIEVSCPHGNAFFDARYRYRHPLETASQTLLSLSFGFCFEPAKNSSLGGTLYFVQPVNVVESSAWLLSLLHSFPILFCSLAAGSLDQ